MTAHPGAHVAQAFAPLIIEALEQRGWSVAELADRASIRGTQLRRMLDGEDALNTDHIAKLAWALSLDTGELLRSASEEVVEEQVPAERDFEDVLLEVRANGWEMQRA